MKRKYWGLIIIGVGLLGLAITGFFKLTPEIIAIVLGGFALLFLLVRFGDKLSLGNTKIFERKLSLKKHDEIDKEIIKHFEEILGEDITKQSGENFVGGTLWLEDWFICEVEEENNLPRLVFYNNSNGKIHYWKGWRLTDIMPKGMVARSGKEGTATPEVLAWLTNVLGLTQKVDIKTTIKEKTITTEPQGDENK